MSDDKTKQDGRDDSKIDANDPNELAYASRKWNVSKESIRNAIKEVGNSRAKVREYLQIQDEEE